MSTFDERKAAKTERLQLREEERQTKIERRKEEKKETEVEEEQVDVFWELFEKERKRLEEMLNDVDETDVVSHLDSLGVDLQKFQKFITDSTFFLPAYGVRRAQKIMTDLNGKFQSQQDALIPKKKFGFKRKAATIKNIDEKENDSRTACENVESVAQYSDAAAAVECGFSDHEKDILELSSDEVDKKDVMLARLRSCVVRIKGCPSTVHMSHLESCIVLTGPVSTSVFIDKSNDCQFVVACQQLRTHTTTSSDIYLHVASRAIIEDCKEVRFAPYNWRYDGSEEDFVRSELNRDVNNWSSVDDFNWLAKTCSPNWHILPENQRKLDWDKVALSR